MIDPIHLLNYVIRPTLKDIGLWSVEAELLVLGTACAESDCGRWLRQKGTGPALGIFQMEPATHNDICTNFLNYKPELAGRICKATRTQNFIAADLITNLAYAAAMCRVHYLRDKEPIPRTLPEQAEYYKRVYNTHLGAGTADGYIKKWRQFVPAGML